MSEGLYEIEIHILYITYYIYYIEIHFRLIVLSDNLYLRGDHIWIHVLRILLEIGGKQAPATIRQGGEENPPKFRKRNP